MKHYGLLFFLLFISSSLLWAGDVARFVNLGFSPNGSHFAFAQHGYSTDNNETFANVFFVDVVRNVFVPGGVHSNTRPTALQLGDNADGTLFELIERLANLRRQHNIDFNQKGRVIYVNSSLSESLRNDLARPANVLQFRDFESGYTFHINLQENTFGNGANVSSSFFIDVTATNSAGISRSHRVGLPNFVRQRVIDYAIEQIILAPGGNSLVFVVARREFSPSGSPNIRYMVETVNFR
ncbi:MAG: DUF2259 domain-containing protein [Spirochaetaceae bacterium]|nr:DUF2259 domain-containing protein [Spirochaetaceae bacterium]